MAEAAFDPRAILCQLEQHHVSYVLVGALARVLHGTDEITRGVDVCPQRRDDNLDRLDLALAALNADPAQVGNLRAGISAGEITTLTSTHGEVRIVPVPQGTRNGWDDLRWRANREPLGNGLRVAVASIEDLVRMSAALGRSSDDLTRLQLEHLLEIDRSLGVDL